MTVHSSSVILPKVADDSLAVIASHLHAEEAIILCGLLESAGIVSGIRDDEPSEDTSTPVIGGVKLLVRPGDAKRALEMVWSAGVLPGSGPEEPVEITEEVWVGAAAAASPCDAGSPSSPAPSKRVWPRRALIAGLILAALLLARYTQR